LGYSLSKLKEDTICILIFASKLRPGILRKLLCLYKKSDQLLKSGRFGEGLWPLHPASGQFIHWLIRFHGLTRGLEVGAGIGFSTAWIVSALLSPPCKGVEGSLVSLEYFLPKVKQWEKHMRLLFGEGYEKTVTMIPSSFELWLRNAGRKKFDFVFFDQRKEDYLAHLKLLLPRLKKGAFIVADNVISHAKFCQDYLDFVKKDRRFRSVTLDIGQGIEVSQFS